MERKYHLLLNDLQSASLSQVEIYPLRCASVGTTGIVCQILSWRTKNRPYFISVLDTVTVVVPLHSVYQAPSYGPILTLLAWFLLDLAYLSMLFILEVL